MTDTDIQCLKDNVDKMVEIQTVDGELLIAKIVFVTHCKEYDEHDVHYEVVSSNMMDWYVKNHAAGGYVLDFDKIVSVKPVANV
jgi:uncharacterized membrane protein YkvI